jgi:hypothetical protein
MPTCKVTANGQTIRFEVESEGVDFSYVTASLNEFITVHGTRGYNNSTPAVIAAWDNYKITEVL